MTEVDEIEEAMLHGANAMFIVGLWVLFKRNQEVAMQFFAEAAARVLDKREVKLATPDAQAKFHAKLRQKFKNKLEDPWK